MMSKSPQKKKKKIYRCVNVLKYEYSNIDRDIRQREKLVSSSA